MNSINPKARRAFSFAAALLILFLTFLSLHMIPEANAADVFRLFAIKYSNNIYGIAFAEQDEDAPLTRLPEEGLDLALDVFSDSVAEWSVSQDGASPEVTDSSASAASELLRADFSSEPMHITWYNELSLVVNAETQVSDPSVVFTLYTDSSVYNASAFIESSADYLLAVPLSGVPDTEKVTGFSVYVENASHISVREVYADNRKTVQFTERYLAADVSARGDNLSVNQNKILISPENEENTELRFSSILLPSFPENDPLFLEITLSATHPGGTLEVAHESGTRPDSSVTISSGTNTYYLKVADPRMSEYILVLSPENKNTAYELESIRYFSYASVSAYVTESLGKVSDVKLTSDGSHVTLTGSLTSSSVVKYIGSSIAVFELPLGISKYDAARLSPVATLDISTQFNVSVSISDKNLDPTVSMYAAAVLTDNGPLFISEPRCVAPRPPASSSPASIVALSGASTVGVFESNAAHAVIDVDLALLTGGSTPNKAGKICTYKDKYFYLDTDMIAELDRAVAFYSSSDVLVYLRLISSEDLSSLGYTLPQDDPSGPFMFDTSNENGRAFFTAVVRFLAQRYPKLSGLISGYAANASSHGMTDVEYAESCVMNLRLMQNILSSVGNGDAYLALADGGAYEPSALYQMIYYYMSQHSAAMPKLAWTLGSFGGYDSFLYQLDSFGTERPKNPLFFCPESTDGDTASVISEYASLADDATRYSPRALVLPIRRSHYDSDIYEKLSAALNSMSSSRYTYSYDASIATKDHSASVSLYDFSQSFSSDGWVRGNGCKSIMTQLHSYFGGNKRSLEADFPYSDENASAGGVILYKPPKSPKLSSADALRLSLYAESDADSFEIKLILGYGETRYEYSASVAANVAADLDCILSEIPSDFALDYIAIVVKSDSALKLNISEISAHSDSISVSELAEAILGAPQAEEQAPDNRFTFGNNPFTAAVIIALLLSVVIFAMLSYRKKN